VYPVVPREMSIDEAKEEGAMALFGEKYDDKVRVITVGDYSKELCGGTHLSASGEAGLIKIVSENGIAAGVRRIEAITGTGALSWYKERERLLQEVSEAVKSSPEEAPMKIAALTQELKNVKRELEDFKKKMVSSSFDEILKGASKISGISLMAARLDQLDMNGLRDASDSMKNKLGSSVIVLASGLDNKVNIIVSATKDAVAKGIHCGKIIAEAAKAAGGGGGGRPDMAQAGGKDITGIDKALEIAIERVKAILTGN
jgi:alanyl-tRNA synthetase